MQQLQKRTIWVVFALNILLMALHHHTEPENQQ
jgi:hypothetical protein